MASEAKARKKANQALAALPNYHRWIPNQDIDEILAKSGFSPLEEGIYCGREGRIQEKVGENSWFFMSWYKMPSGNYEIVSYVS